MREAPEVEVEIMQLLPPAGARERELRDANRRAILQAESAGSLRPRAEEQHLPAARRQNARTVDQRGIRRRVRVLHVHDAFRFQTAILRAAQAVAITPDTFA